MSLQPSSIIEARASRITFSIGYSRLSPLPPKICTAELATSKQVFVAVTFDAIWADFSSFELAGEPVRRVVPYNLDQHRSEWGRLA